MLDGDRIVYFIFGGFLIFQAVYLLLIKTVVFDTGVEEHIFYQNLSNYAIVAIIASILFVFTGFLIITQSRLMKYFIIASVVTHIMLITLIPLFLNYEKDPNELEILPVPHTIILTIVKIISGQETYSLVNLIFGFVNVYIWFIIHKLEN